MYVFMYLLMPGFVATPVLKLKQIKFIFYQSMAKYGSLLINIWKKNNKNRYPQNQSHML